VFFKKKYSIGVKGRVTKNYKILHNTSQGEERGEEGRERMREDKRDNKRDDKRI
jgi:hypothetical protein